MVASEPMLTETLCRWWPELGSIEYSFRYELTVVERKPVRRVVSVSRMSSRREIDKALDLLGRDGYDVIIKSSSWIEWRFDFDTEEEKAAFRSAWQRLGNRETKPVASQPLDTKVYLMGQTGA